MLFFAWFYADITDKRIVLKSEKAAEVVADGDSFIIGSQKIRLKGIDAPEYAQTCQDGSGKPWACGQASRTALQVILKQPDLSCEINNKDRFARALATCSTAGHRDIAKEQVRTGMAVSNEFNGLRDYGPEEDEARKAKWGIWQGAFIHPKDWRAQHSRHSPSPQ